MSTTKIFEEHNEVATKMSIFDVTKEELLDVALVAAANKNNATSLQPKNSPGLLSYIFGVEALRIAFLRHKGWECNSDNNIESVINPEKNLKVIFQNVDVACSSKNPQAISKKGPGVKKLLETNKARYLFDYMEEEDEIKESETIWVFCMSSNGDDLKAELSLPYSIENNNFSSFRERVFILTNDDWSPIDENFENDGQDFDINISRK